MINIKYKFILQNFIIINYIIIKYLRIIKINVFSLLIHYKLILRISKSHKYIGIINSFNQIYINIR